MMDATKCKIEYQKLRHWHASFVSIVANGINSCLKRTQHSYRGKGRIFLIVLASKYV